MDYSFIKAIPVQEDFLYRFSICTLVSDKAEYNEMINSFLHAGFTTDICEYLYIDNTITNAFEAYAGLNRFLRTAKGRYIILCHQDILLDDHKVATLDNIITEMDQIDDRWGILGNAGGLNIKYRVMNITQGTGKQYMEKGLPAKTMTVDENFILVKNEANLALSSDLEGFHLYGADMCFIAEALGYNAYIIDFNITHKSSGNADQSFYKLKHDLLRKYRKAFKGRFVSTTITRFYLSGNNLKSIVYNSTLILFIARQYYKFFRKKDFYRVKK